MSETGRPILAFDTATTIAVVALGTADGELLGSSAWTAGYRHGEELLARVDAVLAEAGVRLAELGAIAVGTGPGAFTGLRVGLATAKGLAHGLAVPIVGIPTASALLAAVTDDPGAALAPAGGPQRACPRPGRRGRAARPRHRARPAGRGDARGGRPAGPGTGGGDRPRRPSPGRVWRPPSSGWPPGGSGRARRTTSPVSSRSTSACPAA